ncbi:MFS transporter [Streptomyces sp. NPDC005925]|uniref:MFS transporter n=1 Tax=Streptomyces sp. NPDC005925 TaxID=3157172 RepID=UPI00340A19CE
MCSSPPSPRTGARRDTLDAGAGGILKQPKAVWATAGASVVAFMGIGLVDPILPSIAKGLDASASQVSLLFTSYFLITAVAMPLTGFVSSRIGGRATLLLGLALVTVFAGLSGTSGSVGELVAFRAGRGLGNALFVSTALAVIVGAAAGGSAAAILSTVLAFTPFVLDMTPYKSGAVFFAWGVLLAVFSVVVAPRLQRRFGSLKVLGGSLLLLAADVLVLGYGDHTTAVVCTILSGAFIGVNNTVYTELALGVSDAPRPVASAGYNFVRWLAAAAAPCFAPKIEEWTDLHVPFVVAAGTAVLGAAVVLVRRSSLTREAAGREPAHATEDGVPVYAN